MIAADYANAGPDRRSAHVEVNEAAASSPGEVGLGFLAHLDKGDFIGRECLAAEMKNGGPPQASGGITIDWLEVVNLCMENGVLPEVSPRVR